MKIVTIMLVILFFALTLQADAALDRTKLKRPTSAYFTWLKDSRKSIKGKNVAEVSKKAGEMWKSLAADKKKIYEDRASKAKAEYTSYITKVKGTEAFTAFKGEMAAKRIKKLKGSVKHAMHKVPMDKNLKRPMNGYMLWLKDTRKSIKGTNIADVSKKAGEMWKGLSADKKKTYVDRALEAKNKYAAYVATGKGAVALKAYKEGIAKVKAPLVAKDEKAKAKKAATKAKAKAKAAAKRERLKAAKAVKAKKLAAKMAARAKRLAAQKVAKAAKKVKAKAIAAAKQENAKASKVAKAKKVAAKKAAKAKKAAAVKAKKDSKGSGEKGSKVKGSGSSRKQKIVEKETIQESDSSEEEGEESCEEGQTTDRVHALFYQHSLCSCACSCVCSAPRECLRSCFCIDPTSPWRHRPI